MNQAVRELTRKRMMVRWAANGISECETDLLKGQELDREGWKRVVVGVACGCEVGEDERIRGVACRKV